MFARVATFADGAQWAVEAPTPIEAFVWPELTAGGYTDLGEALRMVAAQLRPPNVSGRALPPVIVLLSDGLPTDDFDAGLRDLMETPWGAKAVRIGIAIGRDANLEVLQRFIGDSRIPPLTARNPDELARYVRWASTTVLQTVTSPKVDATPVGVTPVGVTEILSMPDDFPVTSSQQTW